MYTTLCSIFYTKKKIIFFIIVGLLLIQVFVVLYFRPSMIFHISIGDHHVRHIKSQSETDIRVMSIAPKSTEKLSFEANFSNISSEIVTLIPPFQNTTHIQILPQHLNMPFHSLT